MHSNEYILGLSRYGIQYLYRVCNTDLYHVKCIYIM
ncbi:hypothetical protein SAMN06269173_10354 [Hymenobacter mucosus]|uniref:Uncharacterized protein n=1 Tax=Hymenobacter mucosus TaxID=1411120 RepID=A0A238WT87_9BACT|nr:hypothetical protein SAMN06269173_10354 [Hymenobacter mucosus]